MFKSTIVWYTGRYAEPGLSNYTSAWWGLDGLLEQSEYPILYFT